MPRSFILSALTALSLSMLLGCQTHVSSAKIPPSPAYLEPASPILPKEAVPSPVPIHSTPAVTSPGMPVSVHNVPFVKIQPSPSTEAQTVESLMARLAELKKKRAELEKAEGETTSLLKEKLRQQRERLKGLGVVEEEPQRDYSAPIQPQEGRVRFPIQDPTPVR